MTGINFWVEREKNNQERITSGRQRRKKGTRGALFAFVKERARWTGKPSTSTKVKSRAYRPSVRLRSWEFGRNINRRKKGRVEREWAIFRSGRICNNTNDPKMQRALKLRPPLQSPGIFLLLFLPWSELSSLSAHFFRCEFRSIEGSAKKIEIESGNVTQKIEKTELVQGNWERKRAV